MTFAPHPVTTDDIINFLTAEHGEEVGVPQLVGAADHFGCSLATVKKRLKNHKSGLGKWNLTVAEKLEKTFKAPAAQPAPSVNLVPAKNPNYALLATLQILKRSLNPKFSTLRLLLDYLETVKLSESSKHVQR